MRFEPGPACAAVVELCPFGSAHHFLIFSTRNRVRNPARIRRPQFSSSLAIYPQVPSAAKAPTAPMLLTLEQEASELLSQGHKALDSGNPQLAVELFTKGLMVQPDNVRLYVSRAWVKLEQDDVRGCLEDAAVAVALGPKCSPAAYFRGQAKARLGMLKAARDDMVVAEGLAKNPRRGTAASWGTGRTEEIRKQRIKLDEALQARAVQPQPRKVTNYKGGVTIEEHSDEEKEGPGAQMTTSELAALEQSAITKAHTLKVKAEAMREKRSWEIAAQRLREAQAGPAAATSAHAASTSGSAAAMPAPAPAPATQAVSAGPTQPPPTTAAPVQSPPTAAAQTAQPPPTATTAQPSVASGKKVRKVNQEASRGAAQQVSADHLTAAEQPPVPAAAAATAPAAAAPAAAPSIPPVEEAPSSEPEEDAYQVMADLMVLMYGEEALQRLREEVAAAVAQGYPYYLNDQQVPLEGEVAAASVAGS